MKAASLTVKNSSNKIGLSLKDKISMVISEKNSQSDKFSDGMISIDSDNEHIKESADRVHEFPTEEVQINTSMTPQEITDMNSF